MRFITLAIATVALFTLSDALLTQEVAEHGLQKRTKVRRGTLRSSSLSGAAVGGEIAGNPLYKRSLRDPIGLTSMGGAMASGVQTGMKGVASGFQKGINGMASGLQK
jgi:hypothetical protein